MSACPVCEVAPMVPFLERTGVPVHQNLLCRDIQSARSVTRGDLKLAACAQCGFVSNLAFDASKLSYGEDYDNNQICSAAFSGYVDELVSYLVEDSGVRDSLIVEVGCGKGYFLRRLVERGKGNSGLGFDPSYVGPTTDLDGRLRFEKRFYDETSRHLRPDAVVCRHVIEHVAAPRELLASIRSALGQGARARVFFETPCIEWILTNQVAWDFFYEHCSLFSKESLRAVFETSGFEVSDVRSIFGGQYLWLEASVAERPRPVQPGAGERILQLARAYQASEAERIRGWRARLQELGANGGLAVWGAGAKGATFVNLADPDRALVRCVVDMNPSKQGMFIPGTGHPIVGLDALEAYGVTTAFLMNPNYRDETVGLLRARGSRVQLIDRGL